MVINVFFFCLKLPEKEKKKKLLYKMLVVADAFKIIFEYLLQILYFWKFLRFSYFWKLTLKFCRKKLPVINLAISIEFFM